ncbi:MAG TPA: Uma2 family endonuclease [Bryobacteraceae bacterium]|jgi:Uma2 family endonuclease|nr:Uma2 family endonuclease [Bryobacteraceae bacterium]
MWTMDLHGIDAEATVRIEPERRLSPEEFFQFCQANEDWRIEQSANGEIEIMPPAGIETGGENAEIITQLTLWAKRDGRGIGFDSNTGFILPNGATRSPDAAWVSRAARDRLSPEERKVFPRLCPEFVIELISPSDSLPRLKRKMREWIDNGAQPGWLIDPRSRTAWIYRPNVDPQVLENPDTLRGEGPVAGFLLDLHEVWNTAR